MVPTAVPLLVISGSMGTGKTTVLSEASDLLSEAGIAHAGYRPRLASCHASRARPTRPALGIRESRCRLAGLRCCRG